MAQPDDVTKLFTDNKPEEPRKESADFFAQFQPNKAVESLEDGEQGEEAPKPDKTPVAPPVKKEPGFIQKTKQERDDAKKQAEEAQKRLKELEEQNGTSTARLKELEEELAQAKSQKDVEEILKERDELKAEGERLRKENEEKQRKLAFNDVLEDRDFQAQYVAPLTEAWGKAAKAIGGNSELMTNLQKVGNANAAALQAETPEARERLEAQRDEIIEQIIDGLPSVKKTMFTTAILDVINKSENHKDALTQWEKTASTLKEQREQANAQALRAVRERWQTAYDTTGEKLHGDLKIDESLKGILESHKIKPSADQDEAIAKDIITAGRAYQPEEIARVIRQGAAYPVAVAKMKGMEIQIKELNETIKELRGERSSGNSVTVRKPVNGREEKANTFWGKYANR